MRFPLPLGPTNMGDVGPWIEQYALLPLRVENRLIWLEKFYVRFHPVRVYKGVYKDSKVQYSYTWEPEYRLPENIDKEYGCHY